MARTPMDLLLDTLDWAPLGELPPDHGLDATLPLATHDAWLTIAGGLTLHVYQLDDGQRVIEAESLARFFAWLEGENDGPDPAQP